MSPKQEVSLIARAARKAGVWAPLIIAAPGLATGLALAANDMSRQRRGDRLPTLAGHGVSLVARATGAAALASGLTLIPGIGPIAASIVGTAAAFYPNARFNGVAGRGFRAMGQLGRSIGHLEVGGSYDDSLSARATRAAAIQQMNATAVASRRWLGSEAQIMHR